MIIWLFSSWTVLVFFCGLICNQILQQQLICPLLLNLVIYKNHLVLYTRKHQNYVYYSLIAKEWCKNKLWKIDLWEMTTLPWNAVGREPPVVISSKVDGDEAKLANKITTIIIIIKKNQPCVDLDILLRNAWDQRCTALKRFLTFF